MPVEGKKSVSEFAKSIKAKYPQYKDVEDSDLVDKIINKYPQYKDSVDFELKKKDQSTKDSEIPAKPSTENGQVDTPKKGSGADRLMQEVADFDAKKKTEETKPVTPREDIDDWDSYKSEAIGTIKNYQQQLKNTKKFAESQQNVDPNLIEDGAYVSVTDEFVTPPINPEYNKLLDKRAATMTNARKAFKSMYVEDNPEVLAKLESGDDEKIEAAHKEIYDEFIKEPDILAGTEKTEQNRSWYEDMYHSFKEGMSERDFSLSMAMDLSIATDDEAKKILELEYQRVTSEQADIQAPTDDLMSAKGLLKMVGSQAEPTINTIGIGAFTGGVGGVMYAAGDASATSYGAAFRSAYVQARAEGNSEEEAYGIAKTISKVNAATGAVEGALGAFTGGAAKGMGTYTSKFASKSLKPLVQSAATGVSDMGLDAAAAGVGQVINNWSSKTQGLQTGLFDGVTDEMLGEIIFSAGMKIPDGINTVSDFKKYFNNLPPKDQQDAFNDIVDSKDNLQNKIIDERTGVYLNSKNKQAVANDDVALSSRILLEPLEVLKDEKVRAETIHNALKGEASKKEVKRDIEALDLMIGNVEAKQRAEAEAKTKVTTEKKKEESTEKPIKKEISTKESPKKEISTKKTEKAPEQRQKTEEITPISSIGVKTTPEEDAHSFAVDAIVYGQAGVGKKGNVDGRINYQVGSAEVLAKAVQNIKDVASGKKKKHTKPALQVLQVLKDGYKSGTIEGIALTGGLTTNVGIPLESAVDAIKRGKETDSESSALETNESKPQEMSDEMKEWLGDDDFTPPQLHAATSMMSEYKGKKIPNKELKNAIAKNDINIVKNTEWYNELDEKQQYTFDYDFKKSMGEDVSGLQKPKSDSETNPFVKKKARTLLKEKIKDIKTSIKKGVSMGKSEVSALQNDLKQYAKARLDEYNLSKFQQRQLNNSITRAKSDKALVKEFEKVDKLESKLREEDRVSTVKKIKKLVSDKKSIFKKKGKRWVGKVSPEVQEYISNFNTTDLESLSREEVKDIHESLKGILKGAVAENAAFERTKKAQRRRNKANSFLAVFKGDKESVNEKDIAERLDEKNMISVIDGQLIESVSAFKELTKDNPGVNLSDINLYKRKSKQIAEMNKENSAMEFFKRNIDPTRLKANLRNHLSHFAKAGKKGRELGEKIYHEETIARKKFNEGVSKKTESYANKMKEIFGGKRSAIRHISNTSGITPHKESNAPISKSRVVHLYNAYQTVDGKKKIDDDGDFDMEMINEYMNDSENKKLKDYADYLINDFYVEMKNEYEDTYEYITNTKFPEGKYYPLFSTNLNGDVVDVESIMDDKGNVNYSSAVANNLKQRVKHSNPLDYSRDAHGVAINYIASMERAKQYVPFGEMINDVFNKSSMPEIINLMGKTDVASLMDHLSTVITGQSPRKQSVKDSKFINTVQGIRVFGALAFKLASIPKQLTSAGRFTSAHDVSLKEWFKGFVPTSIDEISMMNKIRKSRYVKDRFKGGSVDIEAQKLLKPSVTSKASTMLADISRGGMVTTSIGDIGGVLLGGTPYALSVYRKAKKDGMSNEDAYDLAYDRFIDVSEETQQSVSLSETSHMQRDNIGRLFSAFTTSQTQGVNKIIHSSRMLLSEDLSTEEKKHHAYNILYYSGENMFFSIVASGFIKTLYQYLFTDDYDEDELKKGGYDTVVDNAQSIISGLDYRGYLVNQLINSFRGDDWKNQLPVVQEFQKLTNGALALETYLNGGEWDDLSDKEKKDISSIVPIDAVIKQFGEVQKAADGDKTITEAIMGWKTKEEKAEYRKNDRIYEYFFDKPYNYDYMTSRQKAQYDKKNSEAYKKLEKSKKKLKEARESK